MKIEAPTNEWSHPDPSHKSRVVFEDYEPPTDTWRVYVFDYAGLQTDFFTMKKHHVMVVGHASSPSGWER